MGNDGNYRKQVGINYHPMTPRKMSLIGSVACEMFYVNCWILSLVLMPDQL